MTLEVCKIALTAQNSPDGNANNYYFLSTYGVYSGAIATETGITGNDNQNTQNPNNAEDFSGYPLTPIKELVRTSILGTAHVRVDVTPQNGGTTSSHKYTIHYDTSKGDTVFNNLIGKVWPVGKGAQGTIADVSVPRRAITSY